MKILVIEDDPVSLKLVSEVLGTGGHVIMLATTAEQAVLSIAAVKPDAILLDLKLPGLGGLTVARQCREEASTQDISIIAVTAHSNQYDERAAKDAGCDAYLVKPINTRSLLELVEEVVAAKAKEIPPGQSR